MSAGSWTWPGTRLTAWVIATWARSTWCWACCATARAGPPGSWKLVGLEAARAALRHLVERGVVPGPRPSDAELLSTLGIDLGAIRRSTEQTFGRTALGRATREATRARRGGVGRVPRTPLRDPPVLATQALYHAGEQARALGAGEVGPELLLLGVVTDVRTPWPRCMWNRWQRALWASVGLPERYQGAAGPLLAALGVDLDELRAALLAGLRDAVP